MLPPRSLNIPVLPTRARGKLIFPLCRTCCELLENTVCDHNETQRALTETWCTPEVIAAVGRGYTVLAVYEVMQV